MNFTRTYLLRQKVRNSLWIIPLAYLVATLIVGFLVPRLDRRGTWFDFGSQDPDSVRDVLSAIATGMMAFTGFVLAIVLLLVQFGSAQFGPRLVRWARQNWLLKHALGMFVATFMYAVVALDEIGKDETDFVPDLTFALALVLLVASLVLLFFLLDRISTMMRPAAIGLAVARRAHGVLQAVYPDPDDGASAEPWTAPEGGAPAREVSLRQSYGATLVTIDHDDVMDFAMQTGSVVELVPAIGEHVRRGMTLFRVYGGEPRDLGRLERAVVLGDERNMDDDPSFAFRLLVDVAIKALSPAVNDPSTAVQVLDWLGGLLRDASARKLGEGVRRDSQGRVRVVYHTSSWNDLVALAFEEILYYGATSIQVCRRLQAMLDGLITDLPAHRRPPLVELHQRLALSVAETFPLAGTRRVASDGDRLGLGMARSDGQA